MWSFILPSALLYVVMLNLSNAAGNLRWTSNPSMGSNNTPSRLHATETEKTPAVWPRLVRVPLMFCVTGFLIMDRRSKEGIFLNDTPKSYL